MKIIGITGPTGAGKTTALRALADLGACVIDADAVYHRLLEESAPMREALTARFGASILDDGGKIERKGLRNLVLGDAVALADQNGVTHRFVEEEIARLEAQAAREGRPAVAIDAIALIESGVADRCDAVVGVLAPRELRVRRIMAREGIPEDYARRRVEAQREDEFYRTSCGYLLENNGEGDEAAFADRARTLFAELLAEG